MKSCYRICEISLAKLPKSKGIGRNLQAWMLLYLPLNGYLSRIHQILKNYMEIFHIASSREEDFV